MATARLFRAALITEWILAIGAAVVAILTEPLLPAELRAYLDRQAGAPLTAADLIQGVVGVGFLALAAATTVGLFIYKRWARLVFAALTVTGFIPVILMGPTVESGIATALAESAVLVSGVILALMYWSPVSVNFEKQ
jgi:hypothetical protein